MYAFASAADTAGVGANGIVFANGGSLTIANCLIKDFVGSSDNAGNGIVLRAGSGSPKIVVTDTTVQNNEYVGLYFRSTANSGASLVADRVVATNNGYGISVTVAAGGSVQNWEIVVMMPIVPIVSAIIARAVLLA